MFKKISISTLIFLSIVMTASTAFAATNDTFDYSLNGIAVITLISIAFLAFVYELFSRGIGIVGIIGIISIAVFFYFQIANELADAKSVSFFIVGILCVVLEFFVPGGIVGLIGFSAIVVSFVLAINDSMLAFSAIAIAIILSIALFLFMSKILKKKVSIYNSLVLRDATSTEKGYVSKETRSDLLGKTGVCLTTLRPAGTAIINGERIDVVTEGDFIEHDTEIVVVFVEGARVVVRENKGSEEEKQNN